MNCLHNNHIFIHESSSYYNNLFLINSIKEGNTGDKDEFLGTNYKKNKTSTNVLQTVDQIIKEIPETEYRETPICSSLQRQIDKDNVIVNFSESKSKQKYFSWEHIKLAVIIDTRYDKLMENVIDNFMFFMNPQGWNLMVISHPKYEFKIKERFPFCIFGKIEEDLIFYDENQIPNISIKTYNRILLSPYFWNSLQGEYIAIFQKDCIMYNMFDDIFLNYDFAGASTYLPQFQTFFNGMINGGFSLRKKSTMLECLEKVNCQTINNYINNLTGLLKYIKIKENSINQNVKEDHFSKLIFDKSSNLPSQTTANWSSPTMEIPNIYNNYTIENINEDIFFSFACEILQKKIPDIEHRKRLSIEFEEPIYYNIVPNKNNLPAVYHGWNKNYHSVNAAKYFVSFSPYFSSNNKFGEDITETKILP